jgi:SAM-dependent methyltransferase
MCVSAWALGMTRFSLLKIRSQEGRICSGAPPITLLPARKRKQTTMEDIYRHAEKCNEEHWDEIAPVHVRSYKSVDILKAGGIALDEIELREVGEVNGKTLLHLQCHIGTDTLSWARQGALVTGVDFSAQSIAYARQLQQELQLGATFLRANVYELRGILHEQFDVIYTSRGVLCWLKDLDEWAQIIAHLLKSGGVFYIMESHPLCNIFDETKRGELTITHRYFHTPEPTLWDDNEPDYADATYVPQHPTYEWNWSLSDILNAVLKAGLHLESFNEYEHLFFKCFPSMVDYSEGWYHFPQYAGKLPLLFTLKAKKLGVR